MIRTAKLKISRRLIFVLLVLTSLTHGTKGQETKGKTSLPMVSAHRGSSRVAPENTLIAFSKTIEAGADFIEIDVRTTADSAQVIVHDGSLKRTTGLDAKVEKTNLVTIKKLSAGHWFGKAFEDQKVPTLEEVCELVAKENKHHDHPVKQYVDCKVINTGEVIRILDRYGLLDSAVFYGDIKTLMEIKKFSKKARVMPPYPGKDELDNVIRKLAPYAVDVSYHELDAATVSFCHAKGIKVFCDLLGQYDSPNEYRKAIQLGVDLIQTDDVSGVLQLFNEFLYPLRK